MLKKDVQGSIQGWFMNVYWNYTFLYPYVRLRALKILSWLRDNTAPPPVSETYAALQRSNYQSVGQNQSASWKKKGNQDSGQTIYYSIYIIYLKKWSWK